MSAEDAKSRLLIEELASDFKLRRELSLAPARLLTSRGFEPGEAALFLGRLLMGEIRVPGCATPPVRVLSPWPPQGQPTRAIRSVSPETIVAGENAEVTVVVNGLKRGDRMLFRNAGLEPKEYFAEITAIDVDEGLIKGKICLCNARLYDVYVGVDVPDGEWGVLESGLMVT